MVQAGRGIAALSGTRRWASIPANWLLEGKKKKKKKKAALLLKRARHNPSDSPAFLLRLSSALYTLVACL